MATNSAIKAITGNSIRHGNCVIQRPLASTTTEKITRGKAWPDIAKIDNKYNTRFDDPRYYSGDTSA